jgi:DNA invertase Pin-like site-specific DNA recombinase/ribosomal protein L17
VVRAAILARVSSDEQHVDAQLEQLRAQAKRDGVDLVAEYVDDGVSGKTGNLGARAAALRMIADLQQRPRLWDVLYVWDFDRLSRSEDIGEQSSLLAPLQRAGVGIRTRNGEQPSLSTSMGRIWASMQLEASAEWLAKHRDRVKQGKDRAIAAGRKPAGPTPYGFSYERSTGKWSVLEEEAQVVREIFARVAGGESCDVIARSFEQREIATRRGGRWSGERVWQIVTKRTARGEWTADKRRHLVVRVPELVTEDDWQAAQAELLSHGLRGLRRTTHVYLLEQLAICARCRAPIGINWGARNPRRPYYVCCERRRAREAARCQLSMQPTAAVDARAWEKIATFLQQPDQIAEYFMHRRTAAHRDVDAGVEDLRDFESKLQRTKQTEAALLQRFQEGMISEEAMDGALRRGKQQRALLEKQLEAARRQHSQGKREEGNAAAAIASIALLRSRIAKATPEEQRDLVRQLIPARGVVLGDAAIELNLELGPRVVSASVSNSSSGREYDPTSSLRIKLVA